MKNPRWQSNSDYLAVTFTDTYTYKRSSITNDLTVTKATIKGHYRTLEEQISSLRKEPSQHDHSAITKMLSSPIADLPKDDRPLGRSDGGLLSPILDNRPVPNFSFVGRESQLALLHNTLQLHIEPPKKGPACCIIHGIGGIGKTQLALHYTYKYEQHYQAIFWLKAQTNVELAKSYAAIADHVGAAESIRGLSQDEDPGKGVDVARKWLQTTSTASARIITAILTDGRVSMVACI